MAELINGGEPFPYREHRDHGIDAPKMRYAVRDGLLRREFHGVYVDARTPDSRQSRIRAARLAVPDHAVICSETASWVYGLDSWGPRDRHDLRPDYVVPHGMSRSRQSTAQCRQAIIPTEDILEIDGLLVTTPLRTVTDLLRGQWRPHALASADAAAHHGLVQPEDVIERLGRLRGFPGIRQARELAQLIEPGAQSRLESAGRLRLIDAGLPRPVVQFPVIDVEGHQRYLDSCYPESKVAPEFDGRGDHTSLRDRQHDLDRRTWIGALGYRFVIATSERIFGTDSGFEQEVGGLLGVEIRPRRW